MTMENPWKPQTWHSRIEFSVEFPWTPGQWVTGRGSCSTLPQWLTYGATKESFTPAGGAQGILPGGLTTHWSSLVGDFLVIVSTVSLPKVGADLPTASMKGSGRRNVGWLVKVVHASGMVCPLMWMLVYKSHEDYSYIYHNWLVVWLPSILFSQKYWECHHPNWLSYFSEGWPNHQPGYIFHKTIEFSHKHQATERYPTGAPFCSISLNSLGPGHFNCTAMARRKWYMIDSIFRDLSG